MNETPISHKGLWTRNCLYIDRFQNTLIHSDYIAVHWSTYVYAIFSQQLCVLQMYLGVTQVAMQKTSVSRHQPMGEATKWRYINIDDDALTNWYDVHFLVLYSTAGT